MSETQTPILPAHIEQTIEAIAALHLDHHRRSTPTQKLVMRLTRLVAQPRFVGVVMVLVLVWLSANLALIAFHQSAFDPPPFNGLQVIAGVVGVFITILVLITQRRENELSEARDQLTLELAILNEQKSAKIIALLEELRVDIPFIPNRADEEARELAVPADPQAVLDALRSTTETLSEPSTDGGEAEPISPLQS
jgi:uncharacterized membrane protein